MEKPLVHKVDNKDLIISQLKAENANLQEEIQNLKDHIKDLKSEMNEQIRDMRSMGREY